MRYLKRWEIVSTMKEAIEKNMAFMKEKEKNPDKYPKVLFEVGTIPVGGQAILTGLQIVEATEEQMMNDVYYWLEIVSIEYIPVFDPVKNGPRLRAKYGLDQ